MNTLTEMPLAQRAVKGDKEAFAMLFKQNSDTQAFAELYRYVYEELYYYALANLGNEDDAADCVQDTALDAFTGIKKLRDKGAFHGWIMKILVTKVKLKQKEYIAARQTQSTEEEDIPSFSSGFEGVEIMDALSSLTDKERLCVSLKYISGYKGEEITKLTGIEHSTVRSLLTRARQKLRSLLSGEEE